MQTLSGRASLPLNAAACVKDDVPSVDVEHCRFKESDPPIAFDECDFIDECTVWRVSSAPCRSPWTCYTIIDGGRAVVDCDQPFVVPDLEMWIISVPGESGSGPTAPTFATFGAQCGGSVTIQSMYTFAALRTSCALSRLVL